MKQIWIAALAAAVILLGGCSAKPVEEATTQESPAAQTNNETRVYESETGPIEVPSNPQKVVLLSGFAGNVVQLGVNVAGADKWSKDAPLLKEVLSNAVEVSEENLEQLMEIEPDLIIALSTVKNLDKLKEIAPTVTYTWGKLNIYDQHLALGKLLNKEAEAQEWVDSFKVKAEAAGKDIKAKIGENATVTVFEGYDKQLYVFGNNWARGTELIYQMMGLKMSAAVEKDALTPGYYAISAEVLPKYAGDYMIFSKYEGADLSFQQTDVYKEIPAVKEGRLLEIQGEGASFTDPITLEYQLKLFTDFFMGE